MFPRCRCSRVALVCLTFALLVFLSCSSGSINVGNKGDDAGNGDVASGSSCEDGVRNGEETDIDCGGSACAACEPGKACTQGADCASAICEQGQCGASECAGVDCGADESCYRGVCYASCDEDASCGDGARCYQDHCAPVDCSGVNCRATESCYRGICYPSCQTDGDCGQTGSCTQGACVGPCDGVQCDSAQSCYRGVCYPSCSDDADCADEDRCYQDQCLPVDCTGVNCTTQETCYRGVCYPSCSSDPDCSGPSTSCTQSACVPNSGPASCDDGVKNGSETDVDCGGSCGACAAGQTCQSDAYCGSPSTGSWSSCSFGGPCAESGTETRDVNEPKCTNGTCEVETTTESRGCSRNTDGNNCGATEHGTWSGCSGFSEPCGEDGEQTRSVTEYRCSNGSCQDYRSTDTTGCSRNTDGNGCAATQTGSWGSCQYSSTCDEDGNQYRNVTEYECSGGSCQGNTSTDSQGCSRSTQCDPCGNGNYCGFGACVPNCPI